LSDSVFTAFIVQLILISIQTGLMITITAAVSLLYACSPEGRSRQKAHSKRHFRVRPVCANCACVPLCVIYVV